MAGPFEVFCAAVCRRVRFPFARAAIRAELTAHLEDHAAALEEDGMEPAPAALTAVKAMGDPDDLGRQLDRLHSPLWGWLSVLSLGALVLFALRFAAPVMIQGDRTIAGLLSPDGDGAPSVAWQVDQWRRLDSSLLHFGAARLARHAGEDGAPSYDLELEVTQWQTALFGHVDFPSRAGLTITDDLGNRYGIEDGATLNSVWHIDPNAGSLTVEYALYGRRFLLELPLEWGELRA